MQIRSLLVFLTACSVNASTPPEQADQLTCNTTVEDYCATHACHQALADALLDRMMCPASMTQCDSHVKLSKNWIEGLTNWYYQGGHLVAMVDHRGNIFPPVVCQAGPSTFEEPTCDGSPEPLPACLD